MAKGQKRRKSKKQFTIPVAVVAGMMPSALDFWDRASKGDFSGASNRLARQLTGYNAANGNFSMKELFSGWTPILAGAMAHKILGQKLGMNRALSSIPIIRI